MAVIKTSQLVTIDRHISREQLKYPEATGEFTSLLHDLTFACRLIAGEVRRAGLNDILGMTDDINIHGESVRRIDQYSNEVILRSMDHAGHLCAMISEEDDEIIRIPEKFRRGKYILAFDPLDGSSNIDVNGPIGTIFTLYRRIDTSKTDACSIDDILQPGTELAAAGYVLYSGSTNFVYSTGNGVNVFTYDPKIGEYLLTFENLTIPDHGKIYSINEGNSAKWDDSLKRYMDWIKTPSEDKSRPYSLRYYAAAVADIHRTLHYGGIYMYPNEKNKPNGKIRLLYEANPLGYIIENAGGRAIDNKGRRLLEIKPESIHQTVPIFMGSKKNIDELEGFLKG